jgi:hyperosmotically inducible protein
MTLMLASTLALTCLFGCGDRAVERAGRQIDEAAGKAAEKVDRAAGKAAQTLDTAVSVVIAEAEKAGRSMDKAGLRASEAISDAGITTQVKAAIIAYPALKSLEVNVTTTSGVVTLTGFVDSAADRERSGAIAAAVAGVRSVENHLIVKSADSQSAGAARAMDAGAG